MPNGDLRRLLFRQREDGGRQELVSLPTGLLYVVLSASDKDVAKAQLSPRAPLSTEVG